MMQKIKIKIKDFMFMKRSWLNLRPIDTIFELEIINAQKNRTVNFVTEKVQVLNANVQNVDVITWIFHNI